MIKALIMGVSGLHLLPDEIDFIEKNQPVGLILFQRNCADAKQISSLIADFKGRCRNYLPIISLDWEGGRVNRLNKLSAINLLPSAEEMAREGELAVYNYYRYMGQQASQMGFNVIYAPVADLSVKGADEVMGDRCFSAEPDMVIIMAKAALRGLASYNVMGVIKHIPGHGRATCDSHHQLPFIGTSLDELQQTDFYAFQQLANHCSMAMTAHVVYEALDSTKAATQSAIMIQYIRNKIGFNGILITDDLSMQALSGAMKERARDAVQAGCDILLHCNGNITELLQLVEVTPSLPYHAASVLEETLWTKTS